jgi:hypothetical protein
LVAGNDLAVFKTQSNFNSSVAFSPDGTRLAIFAGNCNGLGLACVELWGFRTSLKTGADP